MCTRRVTEHRPGVRPRRVGYILTGRLHVVTDDGGEAELGPGEAYEVELGHDAWVVGDEAVTSVEFSGADTYAKTS